MLKTALKVTGDIDWWGGNVRNPGDVELGKLAAKWGKHMQNYPGYIGQMVERDLRLGTVTPGVPLHLDVLEQFPTERAHVKYQIIPKETPGVLFDFDKSSITKDAENSLQVIADLLNNRRKLPVRIEGHTDSIGNHAYNLDLSTKRASAVKRWLLDHKVYKAEELLVVGHGATKPNAPNKNPDGTDSPEGRRQNRRVEIFIPKP